MSYADALSRESDWLRADESASGLPPLVVGVGDNTGPFGVVDDYGRRENQRAHQLFVCRGPYAEAAMDGAGQWRAGAHGIVLLVLWQRLGDGTRAHLDQAGLDEALDRVLARVRGLPTDHTHGGRFSSVAEGPEGITVEYPDPRTLDQATDAPWGAGTAYTVLVRYTATDWLPG